MPWSAQAEHNQDDADDGDDEPDGKPHAATCHETSGDQIHALPGKHSAKDQSDHADGDQGDAPGAASHMFQLTLDRLMAPIHCARDICQTQNGPTIKVDPRC